MASKIKLTDRFSEPDKYEKCPNCLTICQTFVDYGDKLGCLSCGSVFLRKTFRDDIKGRMKEILGGGSYKCGVCGKVFKKNIALVGHMRGKCGSG